MDESTLASAVEELVMMDPALATLAGRNGVPPLWPRDPGFDTMVRLILEQQVSLASADAAFRKLEQAIGRIRAEPFLTLDDAELHSIGFSRQKAGYVRGLAAGITEGSINLDAIGRMDDAAAMAGLVAIRGVGPWTAACYLLFSLRRPDVWPSGDRALQIAVGRLDNMEIVPNVDATNRRAGNWEPLRSAAARMLWHEYLGGAFWQRVDDGGR